MTFFQPRQSAQTTQTAFSPDLQPWVEKYRPKSMDNISSQEQVVQVLKKSLESHNLPHLLFYGPPGTGKTSTILALARELYGPELMKTRVLELNASDERGIQIVREKVKNFARVAVSQRYICPNSTLISLKLTFDFGCTRSGYPCPPYKIIILDEADSMTADAQSALRRTMETYSKITRFCLVCNYVSRIIEPLASRCAKFRFKPLDILNTTARIQEICTKENVTIQPEAVTALISASEGDLRKAIMFLQSAYRLHKHEAITPASVREIAGVIPEPVIDKLVATWQTTDFAQISQVVGEVIASGFSATQIVSQLHDRLIADEFLTTKQKAKIAMHLGDVDKYLVDGADEHLQVLGLMIKAAQVTAH
ncbi:hypothetical protein BC936DRAFT_141369 [Jimgerdemannia flammicorona]|uniref:Replication factor C subunit 2 n=1 Tax=Jimgerdemannia flammicorona TaxID=994334 RepID=A0A433DG78_9FUNG|nr:hypothetical protein BC936DRAFT_141369 [Jimgerdemannia flammicorona]